MKGQGDTTAFGSEPECGNMRPMKFRSTWISAVILALALPARAVDTAGSAQNVKVYAVGNGWHAGVLLPAGSLNALVPALRERFPKADSYEVGWGDLGFYQAKEITFGLAIQALFASKGSLLHIVGIQGALEPFLKSSEVVESCVTPEGYQDMVKLIAKTFALDANGQAISVGKGLYGDSQFYKAHGRYSLLNTCNRWSAEVFQAGGLSMSPRISLTASSVLGAVRQEGKVCAALAAH